MRKCLTIACIVIFIVSFSQVAGALSYTFEPDDGGLNGPNSTGTSNMSNDLWDLSHGYKYEWGIGWQLAEDEKIVGASLIFNDIRNWNNDIEPVNDLWVHLLDFDEETQVGARQLRDWESGQTDAFGGQGILLNQWHNLLDTPQDITYTFDAAELAALVSYSADGYLGFGFDPDCHFYNNGITLIIETQQADPLPEPGTMLLLGVGLIGLIGYRKRTKK